MPADVSEVSDNRIVRKETIDIAAIASQWNGGCIASHLSISVGSSDAIHASSCNNKLSQKEH